MPVAHAMPTSALDRPPNLAAVERIRAWGEARDWAGYDPYDGLNTPFVGPLTLGTVVGRRVLTQAVKLSPLNLRPLLRVAPRHNAKAIALVASGYARLWAAHGDAAVRAQAERWLDWLVDHHAAGEPSAWGYHFDVQTRFFFYPRDTANTIATTFVAQALLDGVTLLEEDRWRPAVARATAFLRTRMLVDEGDRCFFGYVPGDTQLIHNANLLACAVLARAGEPTDRALVRRCVETSLRAQRPDGSWPYADHGSSWVDNFHTGYVLEALAQCVSLTPAAEAPVERGIRYWAERLFRPDGRPRYAAHRDRPLDSHCYAQAIDTWIAAAPWRPDWEARSTALATLLVEDMLAPEGYVRFRRGRHWHHPVPFVRWSTAPSFRALASLARATA